MSNFELDTTAFNKALEIYAEATGKTAQEAVNRGMRNTIIQAKGIIHRSDKQKIKQELEPSAGNKLVYKIINAKRKKSGQTGKPFPNYQETMKVMADKFIRKAVFSSGYIAVCLAKAGREYGLFMNMRLPKGWAAKSKGYPATDKETDKPIAMANFSFPKENDSYIKKALTAGMSLAANDMLTYATNKLKKSFK